MMGLFRAKEGFTLVELIVVVAILGILATIAIPNFLTFRLRSRTAEVKNDPGAVYNLQIAHFAEEENYICGRNWTPDNRSDHSLKLPWDQDNRFPIIGFAPEGHVFYEYGMTPLGVQTTGSPFYDNQAGMTWTTTAYGEISFSAGPIIESSSGATRTETEIQSLSSDLSLTGP